MNEDLNMALFEAIEKGFDIERTLALLASGADPNAIKIVGTAGSVWTALFAAVQIGDIDSVRVLLDYGADPRQSEDYSVLLAASMGLTGIVRLLLEYGAEADRKDDEGSTALTEAARHGDIDTVRVLLEYGADVNLPGGIGDFGTPLTRAATGFHPTLVSLLLEHGADVNNPGTDENTVWDLMPYYVDDAKSLPQQKRRDQVLELLIQAGAQGYCPK